jgi:hypothetical protein
MKEKKAKRRLRRMLATFSVGTVLHLLSELVREDADAARRAGDDLAAGQCQKVEAALFVIGLGIDAARPN